MPRLRKGSIRIEYDRTGQNDEVTPNWAELENRPYYQLEKNYTDGLGTVIYNFQVVILY